MKITFQYVSYKNLMSVGNSVMKIQLDRSPTTLLGGSNGAGKSLVFQAISYALYGKFISDMKLSNAINSINKKNLLVECQFMKGEDVFKIIRGQKPSKFEIYKNDQMLDQNASSREQQAILEVILGSDFKAFCQHVVLDMDRFVPFMKMSAAERRKVIDDVLDTSIYTEMSEQIKLDLKDFLKQESVVDRQIDLKNVERNGQQKIIERIQIQINEAKKDIQSQIDDKTTQSEDLTKDVDVLVRQLEDIDYSTLSSVQKKIADLHSASIKFSNKIDSQKKYLSFYEKNDKCPTCEQNLSDELKAEKHQHCDTQIKEVQTYASELIPVLEQLKEQEAQIKKIKDKASKLNEDIRSKKNQIKYIETEISQFKSKMTDVDESDLDDAFKKFEKLEAEIDTQKTELKVILDQKEAYQKVASMLKDDGIKSLIIKEYLPFFNKKVNEYLNSMGYFVGLMFDESFSESFVSANKENFQYENLSKGQKCRVNLAIWLALLEMASLKNSLVTNLLCLDEILEPLDPEGIRDFMLLCSKLLSDKNLFIITQRFDEFEQFFRSSIKFQLNSEFTEIVNQ